MPAFGFGFPLGNAPRNGAGGTPAPVPVSVPMFQRSTFFQTPFFS